LCFLKVRKITCSTAAGMLYSFTQYRPAKKKTKAILVTNSKLAEIKLPICHVRKKYGTATKGGIERTTEIKLS